MTLVVVVESVVLLSVYKVFLLLEWQANAVWAD